MQKKYINEIMIVLMVVVGVLCVVSAAMMASAVKKMIAANGEAAVSMSVPLLSQRVEGYTSDEYEAIVKKLGDGTSVKVEARPDVLVVSAVNIADENQWRRTVSDVLALDRNLHARKVCGSVSNACTGAALMAEMVGQRQIVFIDQQHEGVTK